jgi:rRNA 2'-O-methyltransferase fibrillarin
MYVKNRGHFMMSIKASCVDSTKAPEVVFANEIERLREEKFRPVERISLEPYERDHIVVSGMYRPSAEDFPQDSEK